MTESAASARGVDFTSTHAQDVEKALENIRRGGWRRLLEPEMARGESVEARAGWRVDLPENATRFPSVDHFLLFIDQAYPYSEIRVAVPGMRNIEWPHVEGAQLLCLDRTSSASSTQLRVEGALTGAHNLLNWDEEKARFEFDREIRTYWSRTADPKGPTLLSLAAPTPETRLAVCCEYSGGFLIADTNEQAAEWLKNARAVGVFRTTLIIGLLKPLYPSEYPSNGAALLRLAGSALDPLLAANRPLPILLAFQNESGRGFVGLTIRSPKMSDIAKGFRPQKIPPGRAAKAFSAMPTRLCVVERVDREWVHGRDHGVDSQDLKSRSIAIVGCGSLGSQIAMVLAQAGVGRLILVDKDLMHAHNACRHLLGAPFTGSPKALALARFIKLQLPTVKEALGIPRAFEHLDAKQLNTLAACDLVISAGVERRGEVFIDGWRAQLENPPPLVCTWTEEYALVGHAVAIVAQQRLRTEYADDGNYRFLATTWPKGSTKMREAGCGNDFQPFGAVDLLPTVQMAACLCLDVLLDKVSTSLRRTWFGHADRIIELGGKPNECFESSNMFHEYSWEADAA
jgi:hypothetical protein